MFGSEKSCVRKYNLKSVQNVFTISFNNNCLIPAEKNEIYSRDWFFKVWPWSK